MVVRRGDSTISGKLVVAFRMRSADFRRKGVAENNEKDINDYDTKAQRIPDRFVFTLCYLVYLVA